MLDGITVRTMMLLSAILLAIVAFGWLYDYGVPQPAAIVAIWQQPSPTPTPIMAPHQVTSLVRAFPPVIIPTPTLNPFAPYDHSL